MGQRDDVAHRLVQIRKLASLVLLSCDQFGAQSQSWGVGVNDGVLTHNISYVDGSCPEFSCKVL